MTGAAGPEASVTLRYAVFDDAPDLLRLAQLDSAETLAEPILVALVSGHLGVALSLRDGRVIADPFIPSSGIAELLRARARQLTGRERRSERSWGRRGRAARRARRVRALLGLGTLL
jgi:hypothetical protein